MGSLLKTKQDSVDYMNGYFSCIGKVLPNIIRNEGFPMRTVFAEPDDPVYTLIKINKMMVDILFSKMNVNKASGIEGIRCDILKCL